MGAGVIGPLGVSVATHVGLGLGREEEAATIQDQNTKEKIAKDWLLKLYDAEIDLLKVIRIAVPVRLNWGTSTT